MKIKTICVLFATTVFASTILANPIEIIRVENQHNGMQGRYNNRKSFPGSLRDNHTSSWDNPPPNAILGGYSRTAIQNAINTITNTYGDYRVNILLTRNSDTVSVPEDFSPVVGVFTVAPPNPYTIDDFWNMAVTGALMNRSGQGPNPDWPNINWADANNTNYSNFRLFAEANAAEGLGVLDDDPPFEPFFDEDSLAAARWRVRISIPKSMLYFYLDNPGTTGFFVSNEGTDVQFHGGLQWGGPGFMRLEITPPPPPPPPGTVLRVR